MEGIMRMNGRVGIRKLYKKAPLAWRLHNSLRLSYVWGLLTTYVAHLFTKITGIPTLLGELRLVLFHDGWEIDYGVVSRRVVTDTGVGFIVDNFAGTVDLDTMIYHACGVGTGAEAVGNTGMGTETTTQTVPDNTRATGSAIEGATANIFKTVGNVAFDATTAVTEHGVMSQAAVAGGVLLDRSLFSAVNVVSGDSIEFSYSLVITSGG